MQACFGANTRLAMSTEMVVTRPDDHTTRVRLHLDGQPVSGLILHRRQMRIGGATVTMGGIGGVHTDKRHRMKGYSRRVMERTCQLMADEGYDVSMLFGIRDFYPKWGFATMLPQHRLTVRAEHALCAPRESAVRPFRPQDMPAVLDIYARNNATRTCSVVRDPFPADHFPMGTRFFTRVRIFVVTDDNGQILAYGAVDDEIRDRDTGQYRKLEDEVEVAEIGALRDQAYHTVLNELGRQAQERGVEEVHVFLPPDHPFAGLCQRYECEVQGTYQRDGGGMMRITNQDSLLEKLRPELERRVSAVAPTRGTIRFVTDLGETTVGVCDGEVKLGEEALSCDRACRQAGAASAAEQDPCAVTLPQWALLQLIIGYRTPRDVLNSEGVSSEGEVEPLLDALFLPTQHPYIWRPDWF